MRMRCTTTCFSMGCNAELQFGARHNSRAFVIAAGDLLHHEGSHESTFSSSRDVAGRLRR